MRKFHIFLRTELTTVRLNSWQKLYVSPSLKGLILGFICFDQHVNYEMPSRVPLTSSLPLDYNVK